VLAAEITPSPNSAAGRGRLPDDAGLALRFPRFTGRWRDDKTTEDATTSFSPCTALRGPRAPARPVP